MLVQRTVASGSPCEIRTRSRWIAYIRVAVHSARERGHKSEIYHATPGTGLSRNPFACKRFACCAIVAVAAVAAATAVVIFTIIIKCMSPTLACTPHRTVHRVVYKHYKFYREARGGALVPFSCCTARSPDILLADGAVAFGERHIDRKSVV